MKSHIIAYTLSTLTSVVSIAIGITKVKDPALQTFLTFCLPVLLFLIADKITAFFHQERVAGRQLKLIRQLTPTTSLFQAFDSSADAFEYLKENVLNAREILNTRLSSRKSLEEAVAKSKAEFDKLIKRSLKKGIHYSIVLSESHDVHAKDLQKYVQATRPRGQLKASQVDVHDLTPINFIVLDYGDRSEVLFGWAISSNYDHIKPVFLLAGKRVVEFFSSYHRTLVDSGVPMISNDRIRGEGRQR